MIDLINLQHQLLHNIVSDGLEVCLAQQMLDILFTSSEKIVNTNHLQQELQ